MEKVDILVKGCPVPIQNMFRGFCSMNGKTISEGLIDLMIEAIEKNSGGSNANLDSIVDEYRRLTRKR